MQSHASETPLSDLIDAYFKTRDRPSYVRFVEAFCHVEVGIVASGPPKGTVGLFTSTSEHPVGVGLTTDADGHRLVLTFADPPAFVRNFGARFNAEMSGEAVLQTVLYDPNTYGTRVNSAKALGEHLKTGHT